VPSGRERSTWDKSKQVVSDRNQGIDYSCSGSEAVRTVQGCVTSPRSKHSSLTINRVAIKRSPRMRTDAYRLPALTARKLEWRSSRPS
jgi:hypothetical protein